MGSMKLKSVVQIILMILALLLIILFVAAGVFFFTVSVLSINEWSSGNLKMPWAMIFAPVAMFICFSTVYSTSCQVKEIIKDKINDQKGKKQNKQTVTDA